MSQSKSRSSRKSSLRDQLAKKRARVVTEYFPIDDEGERAIEKVEEAQRILTTMRRLKATSPDKKIDVDIPALERDVAAAEAERAEHCMALRFRALSEDDYDALMSEYLGDDVADGASDEDRQRIEAENKVKLREWTYHAASAAVVDSDMTVDEWREELTSERWSYGDLMTIRSAIHRAQGVRPAEGIPKG